MAVYLNGRLIGIARHNQDSVIVNFNYKEGDILKLSNGYGLNKANAIIKAAFPLITSSAAFDKSRN